MFDPTQPFALLADLRANAIAAQAVLADCDAKRIRQFVVLGDMVGFGPDPFAVAEIIYRRRFDLVAIIGHPSSQILADALPPQINAAAKQHFTWARRQLMPSWRPWDSRRPVWRWLKGLSDRYHVGDYLFVCGTPREPDASFLEIGPKVNEERMREQFSCSPQITAVGTIGRPGIIAENDLSWRTATDCGSSIILPPSKAIPCPGGVGQPRDRDPRACYAIMAGPTVSWHRVTYNIEQAIARVKAQGIEWRNGERLRVGA
jgi:hypothetical protein